MRRGVLGCNLCRVGCALPRALEPLNAGAGPSDRITLSVRDGDHSIVVFTPGSALLTVEAQQRLEKVAQVLIDRPALRMTVSGTANLELERDAFQHERLNALLLAQKGQGATVVADAEYPVLRNSHTTVLCPDHISALSTNRACSRCQRE